MLATEGEHETIVNLFHQGTKLTYKKGEYVIRPGEAPSGIFYIEQGLVKTYYITKYGEENLLIIRKDGDILGLTWAITGSLRDIVYSALAPTTLWRVSHDQFTTFLRQHPTAAFPILDMVVDMYLFHSERILNLEYRSARERIISFLLGEAKRFGRKSGSAVIIDVPLRHQDIASSVSTTRETASRELAILERQGLILNQQSIITLRDIEKLRSYI